LARSRQPCAPGSTGFGCHRHALGQRLARAAARSSLRATARCANTLAAGIQAIMQAMAKERRIKFTSTSKDFPLIRCYRPAHAAFCISSECAFHLLGLNLLQRAPYHQPALSPPAGVQGGMTPATTSRHAAASGTTGRHMLYAMEEAAHHARKTRRGPGLFDAAVQAPVESRLTASGSHWSSAFHTTCCAFIKPAQSPQVPLPGELCGTLAA